MVLVYHNLKFYVEKQDSVRIIAVGGAVVAIDKEIEVSRKAQRRCRKGRASGRAARDATNTEVADNQNNSRFSEVLTKKLQN